MPLIRILPSSVWDNMLKQTVTFSKDSSNLFFHILTKCNLSCSHCYINTKQHGANTLDIDTIKKWLTLFSKKSDLNKTNSNKIGQTNLIFLGGEPTLHPDLHLAVKEAKRLGFKSITIDTNGYLFHNILDKITPDEIDFLSFSLDGATRETNDAIRGKGSYDMVMEGIQKVVSKNFSCSMIYTVSDMNIHELELMPDVVKSLGINRFFIQVIGMRGKSSNPDGKRQVSRETWLSTIPKVAEAIAGHGIVVTYPKVFLTKDETFQCAGLVADNYFIFPNGRVYQCPICEDFSLHSYEIKNDRLIATPRINEKDLFNLTIPEGCVMNKMIQPQNLSYNKKGHPEYQIACCMLKEEISNISEREGGLNEITSDSGIQIGKPIEMVAIAVKKSAIRCKIISTGQPITFRKVRDEVEGEILTIKPSKVWRFQKTHYMTGEIISKKIDIPALKLEPLALADPWSWDPQNHYWGEPDEPVDPYFQPIINFGIRDAYEMEQIIPFQDPKDIDSDPILDASEFFNQGNQVEAFKIMEKILAVDLRCLDAHAHLGAWEFNRSKKKHEMIILKAKGHYEVGVNIGKLSLPENFNGLLPWGCIDNRPFLRCLHGYGLSLWRLGQPREAEKLFKKMLWLNPADNQGIRFLLADIDDGKTWYESTIFDD